ncbi:MAG: hypothetical protein ABMA64_40920 [Myxococcota bacterium]
MNVASKGFLLLMISLACKGEPVRSYCEALCDWAVTCNATERDIDSALALESCLAATRASDASCEKAETGSIDPASKKLLQGCVNAIDDKATAAECDGFVGSFDEIKIGSPPAECTTQAGDFAATYEEARDTTQETGEQLCNRFTDTFCKRAEECILGDFAGDIPQAAIDALGGTPYELCVERLDGPFTSECSSSGLYAPEDGLLDANIARQSARECLGDFSTVSCDSMFSAPPTLTPLCAASFSSPAQLLAVGEALVGLGTDFEAYIP